MYGKSRLQFTLCLKYDAKLLHFVETTRGVWGKVC